MAAVFFQRRLSRGWWLPALLAAAWLPTDAAEQPRAGVWETRAGYRFRALEVPGQGRPGFSMVRPEASGVRFTNVLSDPVLGTDSSLLSGSGVALGDIDGDGWCDIYFCSLAGRNALYRNLGGWHFQEIAETAGVACPGQVSRGAVFADVNGDGKPDLLVTARGGGTRCFLNEGHLHFQEVTAAAGLATNTGSTSMALADVDGNGTLDLYVANFGVGSVLRDGGTIATRMVNGKMVLMGRMARRVKIIDGQFVEFGEPDAFYLNDGKGHFTLVPWEGGAFLDEKGQPMEPPWDYGLAVQMRDLNGDGAPEIYECNDFFTPDRLWWNDGHGRFRAIDTLALRKISYASMGVDFADLDGDGHMDGLVVEMLARDPRLRLREMTPDSTGPPVIGGLDRRPQAGRNTLLWNRGDGTFAEIAHYAGLSASDWSWMPAFLDVDLDGFEDVLVVNGQTYDLLDLDVIQRGGMRDPRAAGVGAQRFPRIATPNCAFRNRGDLTFAECGQAWGFDSTQVCNGLALADLDNDGDLDVVINCLNAGALLLRNETLAPRVAVRLQGNPPNTQGIGARVTVRGGAVPFQSQEIISGGRYLSGDDPMRVFAAGTTTNRLSIEVVWRSGKQSVVADALPNHLYEIQETGAAAPRPAPAAQPHSPLFADVTELLGHVHHEEPFEDLERQPLLPKRLSQLGPAVAWFDLDGDGHEELIIGSGRNGRLAVYRWDGKDRFESVPAALVPRLSGDSAGMAGCILSGRPTLLVGQSNYEASGTNPPALLSLRWGSGHPPALEAGVAAADLGVAAVGPVAAGDLDGDGDLEVFVGGRVIPGRYPEAAPSFILRQRNGALVVDAALSAALSQVGLVSGAVFSDLTGDGRPELILACEWGPIRVFQCAGGRLVELTADLGLAQYTGWWQSVTTGDLDGDGRMDIVAGNWGLNSRYQADAQHPLVLYYGDLNANGAVGLLETTYSPEGGFLLAGRDWRTVAATMPFLLERFTNNFGFSQASVEVILGDRLPRAQKVQAATLASMVFLNRGSHFAAQPLPAQAQWSPLFGVCVADFDGDGFEDVFLAQNFFGLAAEAWRQDAGRGLLLKGDGRGGLIAMPGQESGVKVYGEQRGCAFADYDGDGRLDVVVTQNGETTRLLHNVGARPGLRVRLRGSPTNPTGIGAVLRLDCGGRLGPARELHAGGGYWSQNSSCQVLAGPDSPTALHVRWPGGKTTVTPVPAPAREVEVSLDGAVRTFR